MSVFFDRLRKGISRNVFFMGIVSLLNDMASQMIYPIWPFFLTNTLGAPIAVVGLIEGIAQASASIFNVLSGWLSDSLGRRKPFVTMGYSLSVLSKALLGLAGSWHTALAGRTSDRFGKGIRTAARDALIAESSSSKNRGVAFGFHRGMDSLGAVVGPLITFAVLARVPLQTIFLLAIIPGILSIGILVTLVREVRSIPVAPALRVSSWRFLGKPFFVFLIINTLFALGNSSDVFIILRTQAVGLSLPRIILLYAFFNATYSLFSVPAGAVSDRIGPRRVMIVGFLLFSLVYFAFGFASTPVWFWLLLPLYGLYMAFTEGVSKAYIANLVPQSALGTAYGVYQVTMGLANFVASFGAGLLWTHFSSSAPFFVGSFTALIAALLLLLVEQKSKRDVRW
ncbi:MFS transporter [Candidatus Dependentiae bacterium HGW-Dependentiae-1]|nr:MAG: MFS transporter [Candidatus Dependentiae bacterium HGW-Dependentiae-1]